MWVIESKGNIGGYRQVELSLGCCADMIVEKKKKYLNANFTQMRTPKVSLKQKRLLIRYVDK